MSTIVNSRLYFELMITIADSWCNCQLERKFYYWCLLSILWQKSFKLWTKRQLVYVSQGKQSVVNWVTGKARPVFYFYETHKYSLQYFYTDCFQIQRYYSNAELNLFWKKLMWNIKYFLSIKKLACVLYSFYQQLETNNQKWQITGI